MLVLNALHSTRNNRTLFCNVSMELSRGTLLRIAGHNGSGKTTLLRIIAGATYSDPGSVTYLPPLNPKPLFIGHEVGIKPTLTPIEYLQTWQSIYQIKQASAIPDVLDTLQLTSVQSIPCNQLSSGQAKRVALAKLWLTDSDVWILDEPFTALDSEISQSIALKLLEKTQQQGIIILTTHHVPETLNMPMHTLCL